MIGNFSNLILFLAEGFLDKIRTREWDFLLGNAGSAIWNAFELEFEVQETKGFSM
jgi:hypothetical protein